MVSRLNIVNYITRCLRLDNYAPFKIKTIPETIRINETIEFTIIIPFPVKNDLNLFATEIFNRSVMKYDKRTIEKKITKLVNDFPLEGDDTIVTPPQNIKTPTFKILMANPFTARPK